MILNDLNGHFVLSYGFAQLWVVPVAFEANNMDLNNEYINTYYQHLWSYNPTALYKSIIIIIF